MLVLTAVLLVVSLQAPAATSPNAAELKEAQQLFASGDAAGALALLEKTVAATPRSFEARVLLGRLLDLEGRHREARTHLEEALTLASDEQRNDALTALGVSYAFEAKADEAARYYQRAFDARVQADDRSGAAGLANALGRVYLESGNLPKAEEWYTTGYEMARKIPGATPADAALWEMRWHHAQARLAARRGNREAATKHAEAVGAALDKGVNENQRAALPYLRGYIAFYSKDYRAAVGELSKGDQNDVFVLGLIAQSYEKLGDRENAATYYRRVLAAPVHNINAAFARPAARAFLR